MRPKSFKNLVQEFCQKNSRTIPLYVTRRSDLDVPQRDHNPTWVTHVEFDGRVFYGKHRSKKESQMMAAREIWDQLSSSPGPQSADSDDDSLQFVLSPTINSSAAASQLDDIEVDCGADVVLIDGDNVNIDSPTLLQIKQRRPSTSILVFVAKNTTKRLGHLSHLCSIRLSNSVGRDAADHLLTFEAGRLFERYPSNTFYVITRDHFGELLTHFIPKCFHMCSLSDYANL